MHCDGGYDDNGCKMPDTCIPTKGGEYEEDSCQNFLKILVLFVFFFNISISYGSQGPLDINGYECPVQCPTHCPMKDMMQCPGGDDGNGCEMPDVCISSNGKFESHCSFCADPYAS